MSDDALEDSLSEELDELVLDEPGTVKPRRVLRGEERRSLPILGKIAKARLVSTRAKQLEQRLTPSIPLHRLQSTDLEKIAAQEIEERTIPIKVVRRFPNGDVEEWRIDEFDYVAK